MAVISYVILILAGSSIPGDNLPHVIQMTPDKLLHTLEYSVLGFLMVRWIYFDFPVKPNKWKNSVSILLGGIFGALDEVYQLLIPGRFADPFDWMMDFIGVCLGVFIYVVYLRKKTHDRKII